MRILHVFDHSIPLHSGYSFRSCAIISEQRKLGYETIHITSAKHNANVNSNLEEEIDGLHFYRTFHCNGLASKLPILNQWDVVHGLRKRIKAILKNRKVDIIHAHSPCLNGIAAIKIGRMFNIPVVYELRAFWEDAAVNHGTCREGDLRYQISRALETYVLKRADGVTTICEGLRKDIYSRGIDYGQITVIPNAVDIEHFNLKTGVDESLKRQLGLEGHYVLGYIGSFYRYEGLDLLVSALPKIIKEKPNTKILLVGGGFQEQNLHQQVKQLGIEKSVIFTGRIPHNEVQRYYKLVDIFIYPRIPIRLTEKVTPLKPLEALAQGRLVVASDVGGHRELIKHGKTGLLFDAGNVDDLVAKTLQLLFSEDTWELYKLAGRQYVEKERNWTVSVSRYNAVYERLLKGWKAV